MLSRVVLLLLPLVAVVIEGRWTTINVYPNPNTPLKERDFLNSSTAASFVKVRFSSDTAQFSDSIGSKWASFFSTCGSNVPGNVYGFEYWKHYWLTTPGAVSVLPSPDFFAIDLTIYTVLGFTITQSEVISCNVDSQFVSSGVLDTPTVSFSISAATSINAQLYNYNDKALVYDKSKNTINSVSLSEVDVRSDGLNIDVRILYDAWSSTLPLLSIANFTCDSTADEDACPFIMSRFLGISKYMSIDFVNNPRSLRIRVPRTQTRLLNIRGDVNLCLSLQSKPYGRKLINILTNDYIDICFTIYSYKFAVPPPLTVFPTDNNSQRVVGGSASTVLYVAENCFRGKNSSTSCFGGFDFNVPDILGASFVVPDAVCLKDLREIGFYSMGLGNYLNATSAFADNCVIQAIGTNSALGGLAILQLVLRFSGILLYDTAVVDTVIVSVPYSCMLKLESPRNPVTLVVTPSPGEVTSNVPSIVQEGAFWLGGMVITITMSGESWVTGMNASYFLDFTSGNRSSANDGWSVWKSCVLPEGSVQLLFDVAANATNRYVLVLTFQACPQYYFNPSGQAELVTFHIADEFGLSNLGFSSGGFISFVVNATPATFAFSTNNNTAVFDQDLLSSGSFLLRLQGGVYFRDPTTYVSPGSTFTEDCLIPLLGNWTTNRPNDAFGWGNASIRRLLLKSGVVAGGTLLQGYTQLNVSLDPSVTSYATVQGETIQIGSIPGSCLVSGNDLKPQKIFSFAVRPRVSVLYFGLSLDGVLDIPFQREPRLLVEAGRFRTSNVTIHVVVANDTFLDSLTTDLVVATFSTTSPQPFGFQTLKAVMLPPLTAMVFVNTSLLSVGFYRTNRFAITASEDIFVNLSALVASRQDVGKLTIRVLPSPGSVQLSSWFGPFSSERLKPNALNGNSFTVSEEEVRKGLVWFSFRLLGDQWRQERSPYVSMFTGIPGESTGLLSLIGQLVPSVEYFTFTSEDPYQFVKVILQSSDTYDISREETVTIRFSADSTSTGLPPTFSDGSSGFTFTVVPSPGRLIMSGRTALTEKIMREGGSRILLTLFGETWRPDAAQCVRNGMRITTSDVRDVLFNTTIVPLFGGNIVRQSPQVISILFSEAKTYSLLGAGTDTLNIVFNTSACFASGLLPSGLLLVVHRPWTAADVLVVSSSTFVPNFNLTVAPGVTTGTVAIDASLDNMWAVVRAQLNRSTVPINLTANFNGTLLSGTALPSQVQSTLPWSNGYALKIVKTLGELSVTTDPPVLTEEALRNRTCRLFIRVDGNEWAVRSLVWNNTLNYNHTENNTVVACTNVTNTNRSLFEQALRTTVTSADVNASNAVIAYVNNTFNTVLSNASNYTAFVEQLSSSSIALIVQQMSLLSGATVVGVFYTTPDCANVTNTTLLVQQNTSFLSTWRESSLAPNISVNWPRLRGLLLSGFASSSSPAVEKNGFTLLMDQFFDVASIDANRSRTVALMINATTLTIGLKPVPSYAITADESISFLLQDATLMVDGILPDPRTVSLFVKVKARSIFLLYSPPGGQYDETVLQSSVANVMGMPSAAAVNVSFTGRRGVQYTLVLSFAATPSAEDPRDSTELTSSFLAFQQSYIAQLTGVLCASVTGECNTSSTTLALSESTVTDSGLPLWMWLLIAIVVVVIVGGAYYVSLVYDVTGLSGSVRPKHVAKETFPYAEGEGPATVVRVPTSELTVQPLSLKDFVRKRNATSKDETYFVATDFEDLEDEPATAVSRDALVPSTVEGVMEVQSRAARCEEMARLRRRGHNMAQRAVDLRADFQL